METQEENEHFTDLNDDCILEVISRLPINDFSAVRQTCKKLKNLSESHIQRHPELIPKSLTIAMQKNLIKIRHPKKYPKYIRELVKTLKIDANFSTSDELIQFMQKNCGKNVETLRLDDSRVAESFGEGIKHVLEHVKMVEFIGPSDGFDNILTKCKNIKYLQIYDWNRLTEMPHSRYPTLEVFDLFYLEVFTAPWNELTTLFQENPNIKRFVCTLNLKTVLIKRLLSILVENGNIDELFMHLFRMDGDFDLIFNELKMLTERTNFKRLELKLSCRSEESRTINVLAPLQHLTGLHLDKWIHSPNDPNGEWPLANIHEMIHLKVLRLEKCSLDETIATTIARELQNLEVFHHKNVDDHVQVSECIKPFARYSTKLTEMVVICEEIIDDHKDMPKLNAERRKLANASKLIILIKEDSDVDWSEQLHGVDNDLVNVRRAEIRDVTTKYKNKSPLNDYEIE